LKSGYRLVFKVNTHRLPVSGSTVYPEESCKSVEATIYH
jgi:hypothetical protein